MMLRNLDYLTNLREEHEAITHHMASVNRIMRSRSPSPEKLRGLINDLGLAITKHLADEEKMLYRPLKMKLGRDSPTDLLLVDHRLIRRSLELLRLACVEYETTKNSSHEVLQRSFDSLRRDLGRHLKKEEVVLFWLADFKLSSPLLSSNH